MLESNLSGGGVFGGSAVPETGCAFFSDCEPPLRSRKTQSEKLRGLGQSPRDAKVTCRAHHRRTLDPSRVAEPLTVTCLCQCRDPDAGLAAVATSPLRNLTTT